MFGRPLSGRNLDVSDELRPCLRSVAGWCPDLGHGKSGVSRPRSRVDFPGEVVDWLFNAANVGEGRPPLACTPRHVTGPVCACSPRERLDTNVFDASPHRLAFCFGRRDLAGFTRQPCSSRLAFFVWSRPFAVALPRNHAFTRRRT